MAGTPKTDELLILSALLDQLERVSAATEPAIRAQLEFML
jgi:hypothetical protein